MGSVTEKLRIRDYRGSTKCILSFHLFLFKFNFIIYILHLKTEVYSRYSFKKFSITSCASERHRILIPEPRIHWLKKIYIILEKM